MRKCRIDGCGGHLVQRTKRDAPGALVCQDKRCAAVTTYRLLSVYTGLPAVLPRRCSKCGLLFDHAQPTRRPRRLESDDWY